MASGDSGRFPIFRMITSPSHGNHNSTPTLFSSSPYMQEILSRYGHPGQLPDLIASLPRGRNSGAMDAVDMDDSDTTNDGNVPRSNAIDIPALPGDNRRRRSVIPITSSESVGQELRRIADDFERLRLSASSPITGRSRSFSFLQQLPRISSSHNRRNSTSEYPIYRLRK